MIQSFVGLFEFFFFGYNLNSTKQKFFQKKFSIDSICRM